MKYNRILLKLSGESLQGKESGGIDPERLNAFSSQVRQAADLGVQIGVVIGGGNIFRGLQGAGEGIDRQVGDYMGMLATVINSLALKSALEKMGLRVKLMSGLDIPKLTEPLSGMKAIQYLEERNVVIFSGGTGNPFFTTDTAAALRAVEIRADALLKGTRVDGVYSADPERHPEAQKFHKISFKDAYELGLKIMDLTAFTLCEENNVPIVVFNMNQPGNLVKLLQGEDIGTIVSGE